MKKTLTLLLLAITGLTYAQVEVGIRSVSPTNLESTASGTQIPLEIVLENNGTGAISAGDTIAYSMLILDPNGQPGQNLITQYPQNAAAGNLVLTLLTEEMAAGGTYTIETPLNTTLIARNSFDIIIGITAYHFDRSNPQVDSDSSNNVSATTGIWYNQYQNGVSVNEVSYNGKIAAYPNPAKDILNVEILYANLDNTKVELVDLTGKVVESALVSDLLGQGAIQLNVSDVENGIYILKLTNGEEVSTTKVTVSH
jgi:hypothetical protein